MNSRKYFRVLIIIVVGIGFIFSEGSYAKPMPRAKGIKYSQSRKPTTPVQSKKIKNVSSTHLRGQSRQKNVDALFDAAVKENRVSSAQRVRYSSRFKKMNMGDEVLLTCLKRPKCDLGNTLKLLEGKSELHKKVYIQSPTENIQQLNKKVGNITESIMHKGYEASGWERIPSEIGGKGIDGMYVKRNRQNNIVDVLFAESKYGSSPLGETRAGRQMSHIWIKENVLKNIEKNPGNEDYQTIKKFVDARSYRAQVFNMSVKDNKMNINVSRVHSKDGNVKLELLNKNEDAVQSFSRNQVIDIFNPSNSYQKNLVETLNDSIKHYD